MKTVGSKAEVFHGTAKHTSGRLTKKDLMKHHGRIISRKKHAAGKKAIKHLFALGYKPKKGKFTVMRKSMAHHHGKKKRHTRRRGGADMGDMMKSMGLVTDKVSGPQAAK
jgi:hypothetical protein